MSDTHRASAVPLLTRTQEQAVEHRNLPLLVVLTLKDPEIRAEQAVLTSVGSISQSMDFSVENRFGRKKYQTVIGLILQKGHFWVSLLCSHHQKMFHFVFLSGKQADLGSFLRHVV